MFLNYRNQGERHFGLQPIAPYPRKVWELQFITEGQCSIVVQENGVNRDENLTGPVLSITGPECVHGWSGKPSDVCKVTVFHFNELDVAVRTIVGNNGYRLLRFSPRELPLVQSLYDRCGDARRAIGTSPPEVIKRAGFFEPLIYGIVAMELTLFFLRHLPKSDLGPVPNYEKIKVAEALAWYESNLSQNPSIQDVAKAVHLSSTHLRRLFHKIRGMSPQTAFTHVQFERVKWLMRNPAMTLEQIGENSGFGSSSAFSRTFKIEFGLSPRAYRAKLLADRAFAAKK